MNLSESSPRNIFRHVQARELSAITGRYHQPANMSAPSDRPPLDVWLSFDNGVTIGFRTRGDGKVQVEIGMPSGIQMEEAGTVVLRELSDDMPFVQVRSRRLIAVYCLSEASEAPIPPCFGYKLVFENKAELVVLNWGDELFVGGQIPSELEKEDLLEARFE